MRLFRQAPLKTKMIWIISLTSLFVLGCSIAGFSVYDRISYKNSMVSEQRVLASIIAERSAAAVAFNDKENAQSNLESLRAHKSVSSACIYSNERLFAAFLGAADQTRCPTTPPEAFEFRFSDRFLETLAPIKLNSLDIGQLYIISTLSPLEQRTASMSLIAVCFLLVIGGIGLLIASRLMGIAIKPLNHLESTARAITERRDYSVRSEKDHDDDIGLLIDTFNSMLDTIEQQNNALKNSEETLKSIINDAPDLMQIVDRYGNIIFVNRETDLTTISSNLFDNLSGDQLEIAQAALSKVFSDGQTAEYETRESISGHWFAHHIGPLRENGEIRSALVMKRDISALKQAHEKLSRIAFYDPLTGLPNRRHFRERLMEAMDKNSSSSYVALLFMDLDNFKPINDTLGHEAGDHLLITVANRLSNCIRNVDLVSRLGGDEFTVMLTEIHDVEVATRVARKILDSMQAPIYLGKESVQISISIGVAVAPLHGHSAKELMHSADTAMYSAKAQGKNTMKLFDESMADDIKSGWKIEQELRDAISHDQFQIYYQPQVALESSQVVGIEALMRWNHPERGQLQPDSFIEQIENHGLMMDLTKWTLHTACQEMQRASSENNHLGNIRLAINISARQFRDPELVEFIDSILKETGFPPHLLELDITETSLMTDLEQSIATMKALRRLGISLSIDDFGTGYASLNSLHHLPINFLKIDRSFISELPANREHREITTAMIAMAHNLKLGVMAEGVESEEQYQFLRKHNCNCAQGYYFAPPIPCEQLADLEGLQKKRSAKPTGLSLIKG